MTEKFILDACCGGKQFWYDKNHPNAIYIDIRQEDKGCLPIRPNFEVKPDELMDFRDLKFPDKKFKLVVWDPPQLKSLGPTSIMRKKYGCLDPVTWEDDLRKGFSECWRVLDDFGVLIFKWNETEVSVKKCLELFCAKPLFGHITGKVGKTKWLCFMKFT